MCVCARARRPPNRWRDTKNSVATQWQGSRTPQNVADQICDFWYGCASTAFTGKAQQRYGPEEASKHFATANKECDAWIKAHGTRLSGSLADLKVDESVAYPDDGSIKAAEFSGAGAGAETEEGLDLEEPPVHE